jgi:cytochrome c oxidase assembly protein subunit 19
LGCTSGMLIRTLCHRNLMAKDDFKNLGFGEEKLAEDAKNDDKEKGKKGELRW